MEFTGAEIVRIPRAGAPEKARDSLAVEEPLEIRVRGQAIAVTMRTPGHDEELAAGFLASEGILRRCEEVFEIAHCRADGALEGNILNVFLAPDVAVDFERLTRHVFSASSCGLCGKASIESVHQHFSPVAAPLEIPIERLLEFPEKLRVAQETFRMTGGLHAAGIFRGEELVVAREDIGRHNAVDKVIGRLFLDGEWPLKEEVLFVSGRASFEIMQKALAAGIRAVAAVSAPSSLAVEFARESKQALYGFVREHGANRYA
jgi:FdhD protein